MSNSEDTKESSQTYFTLVELQRLKLEPDEILSVKLFGDDYEYDSTQQLRQQLQSLFPNNRIMMFILPNGNDLQMEAVKATQELVDQLNNESCGPKGYCSDCNCGKKAMAEAQNESDRQS